MYVHARVYVCTLRGIPIEVGQSEVSLILVFTLVFLHHQCQCSLDGEGDGGGGQDMQK